MKVAILDDYQAIADQLVDWSRFKNSCDVKVFNQPFENEEHAIENLKDFEKSCSVDCSPSPQQQIQQAR